MILNKTIFVKGRVHFYSSKSIVLHRASYNTSDNFRFVKVIYAARDHACRHINTMKHK